MYIKTEDFKKIEKYLNLMMGNDLMNEDEEQAFTQACVAVMTTAREHSNQKAKVRDRVNRKRKDNPNYSRTPYIKVKDRNKA